MSAHLFRIPLIVCAGLLFPCTANLFSQDKTSSERSAPNQIKKQAENSGPATDAKSPETKSIRGKQSSSVRRSPQDFEEANTRRNRRSMMPASMKLAASTCRASTVTIRVDRAVSSRTPPLKGDAKDPATRSVAVFSGVLVKQGFVATPLFLPNVKKPEVRITLPNGEQTIGRPRILDEYSGLAILSIKDHTIPCLRCCESSEPEVGDWIVSGAAWGREQALVSLGMISGIGYRLPNAKVEPPPMIVCDIRAAQTSKGSGIVAANGKLVGIVMAVSNDGKWTYAVPAKHIHRLLRSLASHEKRPDAVKGEILVLKRQVPEMGVGINSIWDAKAEKYDLVVSKTVLNGPVDQAGILVGDKINSVNGRVVRAWYDVVRDTTNRQPGDKIKLGIIRDDQKFDVSVVLGGGFAASGKNILRLSEYITPEIELDHLSGQRIAQRNERSRANQLLNYSTENLSPPDCTQNSLLVGELLKMLEVERAKNRVLNEKVDLLEAKFDQLIRRIEDK